VARVVDNGRTHAARGLAPNPTLTLTSSFDDFVDIAAERADARKLVCAAALKPSGDLRLLLKLPSCSARRTSARSAREHSGPNPSSISRP
jgi:hypothetical protein